MKFDHTKHDIKLFLNYLNVLDELIGMSDEQILGHFKDMFPANIEWQLLEIEDKDVAIDKAKVLVLLFKSEKPQATSSSMLPHITEKNR